MIFAFTQKYLQTLEMMNITYNIFRCVQLNIVVKM